MITELPISKWSVWLKQTKLYQTLSHPLPNSLPFGLAWAMKSFWIVQVAVWTCLFPGASTAEEEDAWLTHAITREMRRRSRESHSRSSCVISNISINFQRNFQPYIRYQFYGFQPYLPVVPWSLHRPCWLHQLYRLDLPALAHTTNTSPWSPWSPWSPSSCSLSPLWWKHWSFAPMLWRSSRLSCHQNPACLPSFHSSPSCHSNHYPHSPDSSHSPVSKAPSPWPWQGRKHPCMHNSMQFLSNVTCCALIQQSYTDQQKTTWDWDQSARQQWNIWEILTLPTPKGSTREWDIDVTLGFRSTGCWASSTLHGAGLPWLGASRANCQAFSVFSARCKLCAGLRKKRAKYNIIGKYLEVKLPTYGKMQQQSWEESESE